MVTTLKHSDAAVGTPRRPRQWLNNIDGYTDLDPHDVFLDRLGERAHVRHVEFPNDADMYHHNFSVHRTLESAP